MKIFAHYAKMHYYLACHTEIYKIGITFQRDDDQAIRMLKRAYDLGINFYEMADMYGNGKSEKLVARAFRGMRNGGAGIGQDGDEIIYSTKWSYDLYANVQVGHSELPQKHNHEFLEYALEQSLMRLDTELAIKFILSQKEVSVVLPTVIDMDELEMFVEMSDGKYLPDKDIAEIKALYGNNFNITPSASA